MNFGDRRSARKAAFAEAIVDRHLIRQGWNPYRPVWDDVAHPFDRLCATPDKRSLLVCDTKAKAQRKFFPDTGIDVKHYVTYKSLMIVHRLDTYLVFVDERAGEIYGNLLSLLDRPRRIDRYWYPKTENYGQTEIRYFPVSAMERIGELSESEMTELRGLSDRNPKYDESWDDMWQRPFDFDGLKEPPG